MLSLLPRDEAWGALQGLVLLQAAVALVGAGLAWLAWPRMPAIAAPASTPEADRLAVIAHELRTPLGGVLGLIDLVLAAPSLPRPARADTLAARQATADLMLLLRDMIERPRTTPVAAEAFRIDVLMEQVVALLRATALAQKSRLTVAVAAGTPPGWLGDPARIRQILVNLVANAIRSTAAGEVRLEAREAAAGGLELTVADTGAGIPADRMDRLFEPGSGAEAGGAEAGGTGLGLSICRDLAARMGGGIAVATAPGRGTSFRVALPLRQAPTDPVPADPVPAAGGARVLVVDDVPVNRRLLATLLERLGYAADGAADAATAVEMARSTAYAAVLMDVEMPDVDGLAATRMLRALPGAAGQVPVIAVTAHGEAASREAARQAGMGGYLVKPVSLADLTAALAAASAPR